MERNKKLYSTIIFLILVVENISPLGTIRQSMFLEDETFSLRYTFTTDYYSLYVSEYLDVTKDRGLTDFSFRSEKIKAGRLLKEGIWKEISNPFGFTADSDVYCSKKEMGSDFSKDPGGIYGFSLLLPGEFYLHSILYPFFRAGVKKEILLRSGFSLAGYGSVSGIRYSDFEDWIQPLTELSVSKPVHTGVEASFHGGIPFVTCIVFLSGNKYFRPDIFSRLYWSLRFENFEMNGLAVYAGRDYILPDSTPVKDKLLLSASVSYTGKEGFGVMVKGDTKISQKTAYPSACTARRTRVLCSAELKSGWLDTFCSGSLIDELADSGMREDHYSIEGSAGITLPPCMIKLSAGEKGIPEGSEKRWGSIAGSIELNGIYPSFGLSLTADINDPDFLTLQVKGGVKIELPHGRLSLSATFTSGNMTEGFNSTMTGLRIGFESNSLVPYQIPRKKLAVSK